MASYLKLDGKLDGAAIAGFAGVPTDNFVLTLFLRLLSYPTTICPLLQVISSSNHVLAGVWLMPPPATTTAQCDLIGVCWYNSSGPDQILNVPMDGSGNPLRLGVVYKIQLIVSEGSNIAVAVDGVRVATATMTNPFPAEDSYYYLGGSTGTFNGSSTIRAAVHADIIQAAIEVDRTLSSSGGFPVVDADSDPFTDLVLGTGSTSDSAVWNLNDGSGSTATDDSGNGHDLDLTFFSSAPDWAPAADPTTPSPGVSLWTFSSIEGYAHRRADGEEVLIVPDYGPSGPVSDKTAGRLSLAQRAAQWTEDGESISRYGVTTQLTSDLPGQVFSSRRSLHTDGAANITNSADIPLPFGTSSTFSVRIQFYDPGGTDAARLQRGCLLTSLNAIIVAAGVMASVSTTHYVSTVQGAATVNQATSIARSVGQHEMLFHVDAPAAGNATVRIYFDGTLVRTETTFAISAISRVGFRQNGQSGSSNDGYWDSAHVGLARGGSALSAEFSQLYESSGTRVLPLLQPPQGIAFFRGVTITELVAGSRSFEIGTTAYTFRHSTDGGSTWSSPAALTTANLRALACVANGQDVLEISVEHTGDLDNLATPATLEIRVDWEPAVGGPFIDEEYRQLELQEA